MNLSQIWKLLLIGGVKSDFFHLFTPFKRFFAPTSQSPMSKLFRFSESFGKSNGKKWSFDHKGCKIDERKKNREYCLTCRIILVLVLLSASVERCFVSCMQDFCDDFLRFNSCFLKLHLFFYWKNIKYLFLNTH